MSNTQHLTLIVSSWDTKILKRARKEAIKIFGRDRVSKSLGGSVEVTKTFMVSPSGSGEEWDDDTKHKLQLLQFANFVDENKYEDGSNKLQYVIVSYGDHGTGIYGTNNRNNQYVDECKEPDHECICKLKNNICGLDIDTNCSYRITKQKSIEKMR